MTMTSNLETGTYLVRCAFTNRQGEQDVYYNTFWLDETTNFKEIRKAVQDEITEYYGGTNPQEVTFKRQA